MITSFELYMISVVHNLNIALNILFFGLIIKAIVDYVISLNAYYDDVRSRALAAKRAMTWALILMLPLIFIPSKKDLIAIYAVPMVLQNEKIQKLPDVLLDYVIEEFSVEKKK